MNLENLKKEISNRNAERNNKQVSLGTIPDGAIPKTNKRQFLNELITSMHTGKKTNATEAIRIVNETVEVKKGAPNAAAKNVGKYIPPRKLNEHVIEHETPIKRSAADDWGLPSGVKTHSSRLDGERDDLFEDQNAKFDQMMMGMNPHTAKLMQQYNPSAVAPQKYINEQVQPVVDPNQIDKLLTEKLERNMEKMVESTFKSVLTNIYTKQKIHEALGDFLQSEEFLQVVGRAINEIAAKRKAKQGK